MVGISNQLRLEWELERLAKRGTIGDSRASRLSIRESFPHARLESIRQFHSGAFHQEHYRHWLDRWNRCRISPDQLCEPKSRLRLEFELRVYFELTERRGS